ncbi:Holliday junction resolvase RecU [Tuberibacillus sp. Marseille-P3662]|uniref:Holliday junction resolvase RecU n=1 Tax=Tuberibacillus sp. Marseille-P3662 TaxID=1965358 RepID=UPI000A1CEE31|nr:Holliday junction resolvase RecU [Tuberibacillus sp. Marseille-P3662]
MAIYYPNGKRYIKNGQQNQPRGSRPTDYGNRGMTFEEDIDKTNEYYRDEQKAIIHKKPTPVQIVNVDYPKRSAAKITEAYFRKPSTTDYNGIYRGYHLDFEAKATQNKTAFPLQNIHEHQIRHMINVKKHGGLSFLLLQFTKSHQIYLLDADVLFNVWDNKLKGGRKSIPKTVAEAYGYQVPTGFMPRIDYLKVIDRVYLDTN